MEFNEIMEKIFELYREGKYEDALKLAKQNMGHSIPPDLEEKLKHSLDFLLM